MRPPSRRWFASAVYADDMPANGEVNGHNSTRSSATPDADRAARYAGKIAGVWCARRTRIGMVDLGDVDVTLANLFAVALDVALLLATVWRNNYSDATGEHHVAMAITCAIRDGKQSGAWPVTTTRRRGVRNGATPLSKRVTRGKSGNCHD